MLQSGMPYFILNNKSNPQSDSSYSLISSPPGCGDPKEHICYIEANQNASTGGPILCCGLTGEIANAVQNKTETHRVRMGP